MNITATRPETVMALGYAALTMYVGAVLLFVIGAALDFDQVRDAGLALGMLGLALDMRHHTAAGTSRVVHNMSLWQDYDGPAPQHRRDLPPSDDTLD